MTTEEKELVKDTEIIKVERWGRYHFVEVKHKYGMIGIGISRRSSFDPINDVKGIKIATGRALESVVRKILGKRITSQFMG